MNKFFGIPLRKNKKNDDEFVEEIRKDIQDRKRTRIILPALGIIFIVLIIFCLVLLKVSSMENLLGATPYQWTGFFFGFGFGCVAFVIGINSILVILNWCGCFKHHRTEELLVKYHDELKK